MSQFPNLRRTDTAPESVVVPVTVPATAPAPSPPKGRVTLTLDNDVFIALGLRCAKERTSKQQFVENLVLRALGLK